MIHIWTRAASVTPRSPQLRPGPLVALPRRQEVQEVGPRPGPTNCLLHCWAIVCDTETTSLKLCSYLICHWVSFQTGPTVSPDFLRGRAFRVCELDGATNLSGAGGKLFRKHRRNSHSSILNFSTPAYQEHCFSVSYQPLDMVFSLQVECSVQFGVEMGQKQQR